MSPTPILGEKQVSLVAAKFWLADKNAHSRSEEIAVLYWQHAPERGVRPEVALVQFVHETGWGRFGGTVTAAAKNPCGLKIASGGSNSDPDAHARFPTWAVGVIAHLDHLALYAGAPSYPRTDTPDPRHFPSIFASAPTVEALGGKWAPSSAYGVALVTKLKDLIGAVNQ